MLVQSMKKNNWVNKKIGEICAVINGGTPKTRLKEYWDGEHLWITPAEMGKRQTPYIDETSRKISDLGLKNSSAQMLPPYSVILSSRAPIGHLVVNIKPMATNQGCKGLVPCDQLYYKYLYYYLASNVELLNSLGTGATFKELSSGKLKEVEAPLPPLPEQHRIVAILDKAFQAIDTAKANAEKNLKNARELFESYLNEIFTKRKLGWKKATLQDVCEKITDGTHQTPKYFDSGFIFLSSKNVKNGVIDWENIKYIDEEQHIAMQKRLAPRLNDILLRKNGAGYGKAALVDKNEIFDVYVSLAVLRPLKFILPKYLLHFVNSPVAMQQFEERIKGTGVPNLHLKEIQAVVLFYPDKLDEQKIIAENMDKLFIQTQHLESLYQQKLTALDELKKSILHQAFNGEL